ncbi:glycerophosphodiester phosphodiesterase [Microbacterium ulmi]|uniref:GP-PDE domain-containing protein n=1 Tax=Microbacterium ulmi TaxID=179095 RepID=A0A7Y2Q139_9MICO|nr:glycerophosphodiester phosphodiesterase family protein [Microbacterium ulmi]NII68959.1 glycerophosphoryl diester phosphodiesterase [Microbacterium ulmi]NNH03942.1 hypothetical protein [Microbacterium ulmi]
MSITTTPPRRRRVIAGLATAALLAAGGILAAAGPAQAEPEEADRVILHEDFSSGQLPSTFNAVAGEWRVADGRLLGTGASYAGSPARITFGETLENYRFDATLRFDSVENDSRWHALALDMQPDGAVPWQHAALRANTAAGNGLEFARRTAQNTWDVTDTHAAPAAAGVGADVHVSVVVQGSHGEWYWEGTKVFETDQLARTATGIQGLVVDGSTVSYDEITITEIDPPAPEGALVFDEDFSGGTLPEGFAPVEGDWRVADGRLVGSGGNIARITFGPHLDDYRFEATVRFDAVANASRWLALGLDIQPNGAAPWQQAAVRTTTSTGSGVEFAQMNIDGQWYVPFTGTAPYDAGTGRDVRVAIVVHGDRAEWYFDGQKVLDGSQLLRSADGILGFTQNGVTASYDDIAVYELQPLPEPELLPCIPGTVNPGQTGVIIGHRGYSSRAPENTMPAIERAEQAGADYFEIDIDYTADGVPVLLHDDTLDRTTDGTGRIHDVTWDYVQTLDAGSWYGPEFVGTKVPSFEEVLDWLQDADIHLLLEYKGDWPNPYLQTTIDLIEQYGVRGKIIAQSFNFDIEDRLNRLYPELPGMLLVGGSLPASVVDLVKQYGQIGINPSSAPGPEELRALHEAGLKVFVWTQNSASAWANLTALGVDGIITDYPGELREWSEAYNAANPGAGACADDENAQQLRVEVPEASGPGEFIWNIDGTNGIVDLGVAENAGDHWAASGSINPIRVTDTRAASPEWSVSAQVGDFTSGGESFSGKNLGWTPTVRESGGGAAAGAAVLPGFLGGDGLSVSSTLGHAQDGHTRGSALLGADLDLRLPLDVVDGAYEATLTLTALG